MWDRIEEALRSTRPLHAFWEVWTDPFDGALSLEFMAMCNHNQVIRTEKIAFGERVRRLVADRLSERLQHVTPDSGVFTPYAISMALASIGGILTFEDAVGISGGHRETRALVEWCLDHLEPESASVEEVAELT